MNDQKLKFVFYTDGSCRGNPGFAGSGVFGYTYRLTEKSKATKHPEFDSFYFTDYGLLKKDELVSIEANDKISVEHIYEHVQSIFSNKSTNNEAELLAVLIALNKALSMKEELDRVTIYTDSNYIVSSYNDSIERWKLNDWKRIDGKPLSHIAEWKLIDSLIKELEANGIKFNLNWVKGHSGDLGNDISDVYSVIGSNASRHLYQNPEASKIIYEDFAKISDYRKSYSKKDFLYNFRDLYFSSSKVNDSNYCFISSSEDTDIGKKTISSIFTNVIGYIPEVINNFKTYYRNIDRNYTTICCLKIGRLFNKHLYRLLDKIPTEYLITKTDSNNTYSLVGENSPFIFECHTSKPFILKAWNMFERLSYIVELEDDNRVYKFDITDLMYDSSTKKIKLSNKDKYLDLTSYTTDKLLFTQKLVLAIGYDIPNYLSLKNIEKDITKIEAIIEKNHESNAYSLYTHIETNNREIYSLNIANKFLGFKTDLKA